jgi:hypothetical protein
MDIDNINYNGENQFDDYEDEYEDEYDDENEVWDGIEVWFQPPSDHSMETAKSVFRNAFDQLNLHHIEVPEIKIDTAKNGSEVWHFDIDSSWFEEKPNELIPEIINIIVSTGILPNFRYNCYAE